MDESLKITIATLSGFVIAFLAEPIKIYFQNRAKLHSLKTSLYKEISYDLAHIENAIDNNTVKGYIESGKYFLLIDCYKYAVSEEITTFYRLTEAISINVIYIYLIAISDAINNQSIKDKEKTEGVKILMQNFLREYDIALKAKRGLNKRLLDNL